MLDGTVQIVTGGAGGLGAAASKILAANGATVVVNDLEPDTGDPSARQVVEQIINNGGDAAAHAGDVTSTNYVGRLISETVEEHGRLDGIVNFAGMLRDGYLTNMSDEEWNSVIDVHLTGHFTLLRAAGRYWQNGNRETETSDIDGQGSGSAETRSFLTVSSPSAKGNPGQANYAAAKAGILGLTRTAAMELAQFGVRVNALVPVAYTGMTNAFLDPDAYPVEKVAPAVAYLLSDEATRVTGCTVRVAGDAIALLSEPTPERIAFNEGGWDVATLSDRFEETLGDDTNLDRSDVPDW
ncbi:peroxisomal multifunctional enzyme type 2 [Halogeometricum pallidum JCM 14848]|uniref:Peroxisomal multifunctional enzyme type 2 n=1 Tax=Halogeometricum pallidum JCM 14848 TaxID=1227487 RepID=M0D1M1_HALPD|nr:SDR family oxidoreductase [Halogeometricum pallidum]ELZ28768.1 peroxisomal multifunctional enzyme type 2 [Halogeometricum pallidum JCM 14848]